MARIVLGVTGSVAAVRCPELVGVLTSQGHEVRVVSTTSSLYFFDRQLVVTRGAPLYVDRDEWPGDRYQRGDPVLHIELRNWAELLLVAPLDANTLGKFALGLSDSLLTCLFRAWDFDRPVLLAPAMNTLMWQNPPTLRHLRLLLEDHATGTLPRWSLDDAPTVFRAHTRSIRIVGPISKTLACGDTGMGGMSEVADLVSAVDQVLVERA